MLEGAPILRDPDGETVLAPGDVGLLPAPAPRALTRSPTARPRRALVAMLSTKAKTAVAVYPDSDKVGVWSGDGDVALIFPRSAAVDYWHGEL